MPFFVFPDFNESVILAAYEKTQDRIWLLILGLDQLRQPMHLEASVQFQM